MNSTFIMLSCRTQIVKISGLRLRKATCVRCKTWPKQRLLLSWLVCGDMGGFHPEWTEQIARKTHSHTHKAIDKHAHRQMHTGGILAITTVHNSGLWGGRRGQSTACLCVCVYPVVNRDKRHMPCHRLSPLSLLPPTVLTLCSVSPVFHQVLLLCPCPCVAPLRLIAASSSSSNPHSTWSAC